MGDPAAAADQIQVGSIGLAIVPGETGAGTDAIQTVSSSALPTYNNAEGGTLGATVTTANSGVPSGNPWDSVVIGTSASAVFDNTHVAHGGMAYKIATGATATQVLLKWTETSGVPLVYFRLYIYMTSNSTAVRAVEYRTGTGGGSAGPSVLVTGTGALQLQDATFTTQITFTNHVPLNQWVRIEGFFTADPANGQMSASLFTSMDALIPAETHSGSGFNTSAAGTTVFTQFWFGQASSVANTPALWLDDLALSATAPIGPAAGKVAQLILPASPAFIRSQMPRMHLQNLLTKQWAHRDVQGITSPTITWTLNGAGTFTCTLDPQRPDLLDSSGNPIIQLWQTACYLEEGTEIKFGGICTSQAGQGQQWSPTFTEFNGYANAMPYEGATYQQTAVDGLDVVRFLWNWLQGQPGSNLGLQLDAVTKSGVLLGDQPTTGASTTCTVAPKPGNKTITVSDASGFAANMSCQLGAGEDPPYIIKSIAGNVITLNPPVRIAHNLNAPFVQLNAVTPFELDWWNSTDIGQEIQSIQQECIFDFFESHAWNSSRTDVLHYLGFGVPRIGIRQSALRFAEGENIIVPSQISQDGTQFANNVIGLGSGTGSTQIRATASVTGNQLRRSFVYTDQTVTTVSRMQAKAQKVLASMMAVDTPTQVTVINHKNAPFGSFACGDDILVILASGWRNARIWCRITQMSQDPTTNLMTLTLARSDSFSYLAESGQAGTA